MCTTLIGEILASCIYSLLLHISYFNWFSYLEFLFWGFNYISKFDLSPIDPYTSTSQNNGYATSWVIMGILFYPFGRTILLDAG